MSDVGTPTAEPTAARPAEATETNPTSDTPVAQPGGPETTPEPEPKGPGTGLYPPRRTGRSTRMIGEVVVDLGFADREQVDEAVETARSQGRPTGLVLVEQGVLRHDQLARVVAERFGLDYVDLAVYDLDMGAANLLNSEASKRYQSVPIGFGEDGTLLLAMADPTNVLTIDDVAMMTGRRVKPVAASVEDLNLLLSRLARMDDSIEDIVEEDVDADEEQDLQVDEADRDAPIIKLVHSIVAQAVQQGASDIHVNPEEGDTRVLFRVDGVLAPAATVKRKMAMGVVSRIKIMADLDISEKRMPQDGRFALTVDGRRVDIRVVTLPLVYGEGVVLRILDKSGVIQGLDSLGMPPHALEQFKSAVKKPNGAVLVTGPTGSGKSTTLYAALNELNDGERSILTIEDPVEQRIAGIKQMQIAPKAGVTFDVGLRSMLRADPDVIMVGEIRDRETAHIAIEAALTGHLVLSTLHTRDAPSGLGRLIDMGIEPFLVASTVEGVLAQRLVRTICAGCKKQYVPEHGDVPNDFPRGENGEMLPVYHGTGCRACRQSTFRGRTGIHELLVTTDSIRELIVNRVNASHIRQEALRQSMTTLRRDGWRKVLGGITTMDEVARVTAGGEMLSLRAAPAKPLVSTTA